MSRWAILKNPCWWLLFLISVFPYYGIQPFFFVVIFLMIDKSDEFQLIKFILDFKKMIFFTAGVLNAIIGYLLYFNCATLNEYVTHDDLFKYFNINHIFR